jgi:biopolymer transport protein ExbB
MEMAGIKLMNSIGQRFTGGRDDQKA